MGFVKTMPSSWQLFFSTSTLLQPQENIRLSPKWYTERKELPISYALSCLLFWPLFTEEKIHVRSMWIKERTAEAQISYKGNTRLLSSERKAGTARRKGGRWLWVLRSAVSSRMLPVAASQHPRYVQEKNLYRDRAKTPKLCVRSGDAHQADGIPQLSAQPSKCSTGEAWNRLLLISLHGRR